MPANIAPIHCRKPLIRWGTISAANNVYDGTGTLDAYGTNTGTTSHLMTLWDATSDEQDSRIERIRINPLGTNVATVLRFWLNNGSTNATAANNGYLGEIALTASTASATGLTNAYTVNSIIVPIELPNISANQGDLTFFPMLCPKGYKIICALGTAGSAGWAVIAHGGMY